MTVRVVTDTACDLPGELVDDFGIVLVPLHIRFGDTELLDRVQLDTKEFWARCATEEKLPETAAPSPGAFRSAFESVAEGADAAVCVTLSSKLSATNEAVQPSRSGAGGRLPGRASRLVQRHDGRRARRVGGGGSSGGGRHRRRSNRRRDLARDRLSVFGAIDTLENLRKGGRIGGAAATLGTLLSIKPVIEVRDGVVEQESRQRTWAKSLQYLADKVRAAGRLDRLAIMSADASDFSVFLDLMTDVRSRHERLIGDIGPVIGSHAGPGAIGVAWVREAP